MNYEFETRIKMEKAIENMEARFTNVRAGRANPSILKGIMVNYYGCPTPLTALANISIPEARELLIKPFDKTAIKEMEKSLIEANLGMMPTNNGEMIILKIPELTEDRRKEYVKQVKAISEETKIILRNAREEARNQIKKDEVSEDEQNKLFDNIQDLINKYNKVIDDHTKQKEHELMEI